MAVLRMIFETQYLFLSMGQQDSKPSKKEKNGNTGQKCQGGKGKNSRQGGIRNPCKLPSHSGHGRKNCFMNSKSDKKFDGITLIPNDFDQNGNYIKKK